MKYMTVAQLIEKLQTCSPDALVVIGQPGDFKPVNDFYRNSLPIGEQLKGCAILGTSGLLGKEIK